MANNNDFGALRNALNEVNETEENPIARKRHAVLPLRVFNLRYIFFAIVLIVAFVLMLTWVVTEITVLKYLGIGALVIAAILLIVLYFTVGDLEPFSREFEKARTLICWSKSTMVKDYYLCAGFGEIATGINFEVANSWSTMFIKRVFLAAVGFIFSIAGAAMTGSSEPVRLGLICTGTVFFALREVIFVRLISKTASVLEA